jgi:hypothetical protein
MGQAKQRQAEIKQLKANGPKVSVATVDGMIASTEDIKTILDSDDSELHRVVINALLTEYESAPNNFRQTGEEKIVYHIPKNGVGAPYRSTMQLDGPKTVLFMEDQEAEVWWNHHAVLTVRTNAMAQTKRSVYPAQIQQVLDSNPNVCVATLNTPNSTTAVWIGFTVA